MVEGDFDYYKITFSIGTSKGINVPENVPEKRLEAILDQIRKDPEITIPEMARRLSVSGKTIKRDLARLKEISRVKRVGPGKGGHWEVLE